MTFKPIALIPVYNHHRALPAICSILRASELPVVIVDDGSAAATRDALDSLAATHPRGIHLLRLKANRGKGAAVCAGLARAAESGYTHALQIDADGQHDPGEAKKLLDAARARPEAMISGAPAYDDSVPAVRYYGRWITHWLVSLETLSRQLRDTMCGFRVYPLVPTLALIGKKKLGARMDFDTEVMVRLYLAGTPVHFQTVHVKYPPGGESRYRMLRDNLAMAWLHVRLLAGLPARIAASIGGC